MSSHISIRPTLKPTLMLNFVALSRLFWTNFGNLIFRDQHWSASEFDSTCPEIDVQPSNQWFSHDRADYEDLCLSFLINFGNLILEISIDLHQALMKCVLSCIPLQVWLHLPTHETHMAGLTYMGNGPMFWFNFGSLIFGDQHWSAPNIDPTCPLMHLLGPIRPSNQWNSHGRGWLTWPILDLPIL